MNRTTRFERIGSYLFVRTLDCQNGVNIRMYTLP